MKPSISIYSIRHFYKKPIFIDLILMLFFVISITCAIKFSDNPEFDYSSFFQRLSVSLLSIWITVRLINKLIKKREKLRHARQTLIQNLKHPFEYISRFYPRFDERDLEYLKREAHWFNKKWGESYFVTILKENEEPIARKLIVLNNKLLTDLHNVVIVNKMVFNREEDREEEMNSRLKDLNDTLQQIDVKINFLVTEIWKTEKPV